MQYITKFNNKSEIFLATIFKIFILFNFFHTKSFERIYMYSANISFHDLRLLLFNIKFLKYSFLFLSIAKCKKIVHGGLCRY